MTPFRKVHHLCIVVRDVERSVAFYESVGIGPWHDYPPMADYTRLEGGGRAEDYRALCCRWATIGGLQLQVCQPGAPETPQGRFLEEHGEGVYHVGFEVEDIEAEDRQAAALGLRALNLGRRDDGSGFTYFDTYDQAGVILEIRQSPPPAS